MLTRTSPDHCSQVSNHAVFEKLTNKLPAKRLRFSVRTGQGTESKSSKSLVYYHYYPSQ